MSAACDKHHKPVYAGDNPALRGALWVVIAINGAMFMINCQPAPWRYKPTR